MSSFNTFGQLHFLDGAKLAAISNQFDAIIGSKISSLTTSQMQKVYELSLLTILDGSGLMLFRGNGDLTKWQAIIKNEENIVNTNCNN